MASKHSTEVLSSVPECRTAAMCRKEKTHVLDKLYSGLSDSALGCEFNVNESSICIKYDVFKQKPSSKQVMYW